MKAPIPQVKLKTALDFFNDPKQLAHFLDVRPEAIYKLIRNKDKYLPSLRAFQIKEFYPELVEAEPKPTKSYDSDDEPKLKRKLKRRPKAA